MAEVRITKVSAIETAPMGSNLIVVRIDTNQSGLYGYGCATYTQRHKAVVTAIEEYMNQLLVGRDALNVNDAWSVMMNSSYWRNGPVLNNAISGCDMALWAGVRHPHGLARQPEKLHILVGRQSARSRAGIPARRRGRLRQSG